MMARLSGEALYGSTPDSISDPSLGTAQEPKKVMSLLIRPIPSMKDFLRWGI
jgi:hypothetical protein